MLRILPRRLAAFGFTLATLALAPAVQAQKALVYCPVGIDATGCNTIVAALSADPTLFPGGVDAGYDGTNGTVDLAAADLASYSAFLVPSLADGPDAQPYALLRNATIAARLHDAFMGRVAAWSGTPDRGSANRSAKDILIRNLAAWVKADSAGTHGPGVVVLQDNSDDPAAQYTWVGAISTLSLAPDTTLEVYANVQVLTATGRTILTNQSGVQIAYSNMASFGIVGAPGSRSDATGGRSARLVLVTAAGDPADASIATVQTDKDDYFPPDTVVVTGAGWEPGETVQLLFHEDLDPPTLPDRTLTAVADADGHILNQEFIIDSTHVGARFVLTATGLTSGRTAQTTFTDANRATFSLTAAGNAVASFANVAANQCTNAFIQARQGNTIGNETGTVTFSSNPTGVTFFSGAGCAAGNVITSIAFTNESAKAISFSSATGATYTLTGDADWAGNSNDASATVTVTKQNQTISFTSAAPVGAKVGDTYLAAATATSGLPVTLATSTPSVCTGGGTSPATITMVASGSCTVTANQAGNGAFNPATQVTQTFTVVTGTTTTLTSSLNPSNPGQSVTFTATVRTSGGTLVIAGTVTFIEGATCGSGTTLQTGTAVVAGVVTFATNALSVGTHTITACYSGTASLGTSFASLSQRVNALPVITGVPSAATIPELAAYTFDANATDADLPPDPLTFSLVNGPTGAAIDASTGVFTWTPTEAQGPGTFTFAVRVSDGIGNTDAPITLTVTEVNQAPVLAAIGSKTVNELAALTFTATATDGDVPAQTLSFSLDAGAPAGASISTAGAFSWTPTEAQGPGDYSVTVRVSDGVDSDFETISIHVDEVNQAPVVTAIADQTVDELTALTFSATATDGDLPAQAVTFDLVGAPAGAAISAAGAFSWTPTEAQGPGVYTFQVRATDNFTTPASGTTTVKVTVNEVNQPPELAAIGNKTVDELVQLAFTATATDPDLPANTLSFTLDAGAPTGAAITPAGAFTWTPTEAQGSGDYPVTIRVSDGTTTDFETISIHVNEVNQAPVVTAIPDQTVDEETALTFTAAATDADLPANTVSFSLSGAPAGASITAAGAFSWTPTEAQGPGVYTFQVVATDNGSPALAGQTTVKVTVNEVNVAPVLAAIGNKTVDEETSLSFTATATDADIPANTLSFSLVGAPAGASISTGGSFSWTPTEAQGPGSYTFKVRVTDDGSPALSDEEEVTVEVKEVNKAPVVDAVPDKTVDEETALTFTATATDPDIPANSFTFSLADQPAGASITPAGAFSWTPTEAQGPGVYTFRVLATDDGTPALTGETTVKVTVNEVNRAPVLDAIGNKTVDEETQLAFTASASDPDLPANTLTYSLVGAPAGATINGSSGAFTWTPTEAQGPGTYTFTVKVTDNGTPVLSDEEQIEVTVNEVNVAPVLDAIGNKTVDELRQLTFTATATDHDIPANTLSFSLDAGSPAGASITAAGVFTWTPTEAQGPGDYPVTVRVTDNGTPALSGAETITIHVNEVNVAPELAAIGNKTVDEETALTFTASATDADLPANTLTFSLVGAPAGASITAGGGFSWTPTEAQGPGSYTFKVRVTDDGSPALADEEEITVVVNEVNRAPTLAAISDKTTPWGTATTFTASGSDPDLPANTLTYSLRPGAPVGAAINPTSGAFSWTPGSADVGAHSITVRVTDNGSPVMYAEQTFTVTVEKHLTSVVYSGAGTGVYGSTSGLSATLTDATTGTPLSGKSVSFVLGALGASATTQSGGAAGLATTNLSLAQNVGSYMVVTTFTEDAAYKGSSDSDPFSITPAPLSVKADNKSMFFGAASPPPFTVTYSGFVLSQNSSVLGGALAFTGTATTVNGSSPVGPYTITPTGLTSLNYNIGYTGGTLTVLYNNVAGHQFLQPINPNLTIGNRSSFKIGSTIPTKFQLFKADGVTPVITAVATIAVVKIDNNAETPVNEDLITTPADNGTLFRVSSGQYIFNLGTKNWTAGTYRIIANLDDGTQITAEVDGRSK